MSFLVGSFLATEKVYHYRDEDAIAYLYLVVTFFLTQFGKLLCQNFNHNILSH
ncbi:MAG: hypothetical protein SAK42_23030 [Oscillatoria sp. PMC 1076.18]|nr:hypothetical protein [Oscillatoria sp. PMC 1076.18]